MDNIAPIDRDFEVDLESGVEARVEHSSADTITGVRAQENRLLAEFSSMFVYGTIRGEESVNLCSTVPNFSGVSNGHVKSDGGKTVDHAEKKVVKEKRNKTSNKKPPRPPRGPSLDAADQKLIKEISELAMLKRARIERMKALKKMKATKSSSNTSLFAMVFTILFCLVIIFQGLSSRVSSVKLEGLVPAGAAEGSLISVQYFVNPSANDPNRPDSGSPNSVEPVAGSDPREDMRRAVECSGETR